MAMNRTQFQPGLSMPEFLKCYGTEARSAAALERARRPTGSWSLRRESCAYVCRVGIRTRALFQCRACRHRRFPLRGTIGLYRAVADCGSGGNSSQLVPTQQSCSAHLACLRR